MISGPLNIQRYRKANNEVLKIFRSKIMQQQEPMTDMFYSSFPKNKETSEQRNMVSEAQKDSWKMMDGKIKLG